MQIGIKKAQLIQFDHPVHVRLLAEHVAQCRRKHGKMGAAEHERVDTGLTQRGDGAGVEPEDRTQDLLVRLALGGGPAGADPPGASEPVRAQLAVDEFLRARHVGFVQMLDDQRDGLGRQLVAHLFEHALALDGGLLADAQVFAGLAFFAPGVKPLVQALANAFGPVAPRKTEGPA